MPRIAFLYRAAAAAAALALLLPAAAQARPSPDSCAAYTILPYAFPVADGMRTEGTHHFEWHLSLTLPDGTPIDDVRQNEISIDASAPVYANPVNLSLEANETLVDRDLVAVAAMRPDQDARFRLTVFAPKDWTTTLDSIRLGFRYETSPGVWTQEAALEAGPRASACSTSTYGYLHREFGWS